MLSHTNNSVRPAASPLGHYLSNDFFDIRMSKIHGNSPLFNETSTKFINEGTSAYKPQWHNCCLTLSSHVHQSHKHSLLRLLVLNQPIGQQFWYSCDG